MQQAYLHLIKYALDKKCLISVWDGEEWQVERSKSYKAIVDAVKSVEEAKLRIRNGDTLHTEAIVLVSAFGLEPDETVMDYSVNPFMDAWEAAYERDTSTAAQ